MKIILVPGQDEEYVRGSDIREEIETDEKYRARLIKALEKKYPGFSLSEVSGQELDKIGLLTDVLRIHAYIC